MDNPRSDIDIHTLLQNTVFSQLDAKQLQELINIARIERYKLPTLLNAAGEPLRTLRLVVEGHIEIIARRASGREVVISDVSQGSWATWLPCFISEPSEHDFYSSANACFLALPITNVRQICDLNPQLYPSIIGEIGQRLRFLMDWAGQSVLIGPEQRMAKLIYILARDQKLASNSGTLHATQTRLASLARCSRQSANTLLGALEKKGLIRLAYGKFEILDLAKLADFAEEELEN